MEPHFHYGTMTEAIWALREKGYTLDFNLEENCLACGNENFEPGALQIEDVYRYEGNTDPGDETAVYAIATSSGKKGILVTAYGVYSDAASSRMLQTIRSV